MQNGFVCAIVLAAGRGTRMQSEKPKVLHEIAGKPLLYYTLTTLAELGLGQTITVVKHQREIVSQYVQSNFSSDVVVQRNEYGTAKAVEAALQYVKPDIKSCLVLYADNAMFVAKETYQKLIDTHFENGNIITFATREVADPKHMGRVVRDSLGTVTAIVEHKDASEAQLQIKEVNPGLYVFDRTWLENNVNAVPASQTTGEYYVTDFIALALEQGQNVEAINFGETDQWQGVTTQDDIRAIESWLKGKKQHE